MMAFLDFALKYVDVFTLFAVVFGGLFALSQWNTQVKHKRDEIVKELICKVRDDEDISSIMDAIDWNEGILYDGKFSVNPAYPKETLKELNDDDLFKKVDKTLSHFSYICYLKANKTLTNKDMYPFEYELRRIADNVHISNYLYSLYHWSKHLKVKCSFHYLIWYCLEKGYLAKDFENQNAKHYTCFLVIPTQKSTN